MLRRHGDEGGSVLIREPCDRVPGFGVRSAGAELRRTPASARLCARAWLGTNAASAATAISDFMTPSLRLVGLDENHIKTLSTVGMKHSHLQCVIMPMRRSSLPGARQWRNQSIQIFLRAFRARLRRPLAAVALLAFIVAPPSGAARTCRRCIFPTKKRICCSRWPNRSINACARSFLPPSLKGSRRSDRLARSARAWCIGWRGRFSGNIGIGQACRTPRQCTAAAPHEGKWPGRLLAASRPNLPRLSSDRLPTPARSGETCAGTPGDYSRSPCRREIRHGGRLRLALSRPWHDDASPQKWGIQPPEISSWNTRATPRLSARRASWLFRMASVGAAAPKRSSMGWPGYSPIPVPATFVASVPTRAKVSWPSL
jgi:hypothetical protein